MADDLGHSHSASRAEVPVRPMARIVLLAMLALAAAATVVGLVRLWPDADVRDSLPKNAFVAPGVTFQHARVESVLKPCKSQDQGSGTGAGAPGDVQQPEGQHCGLVTVTVLTGDRKGERAQVSVAPEVSRSGLTRGDQIEVMQLPPSAGGGSPFSFFSVDRKLPLGILAVFFVLVVVLVAR